MNQPGWDWRASKCAVMPEVKRMRERSWPVSAGIWRSRVQRRCAEAVVVATGLLMLCAAGCGSGGIVSYGTITTLAGTGGVSGYSGDGAGATSARLISPSCVAVDSGGNVYIGDAGAHVVRKVASGGTISTFAGTGTAGYSGDGGKASGAQLNAPEACAVDVTGNLYIADTGNSAVRKVNAATGIITTLAGTGGAGFSGDGGAAAGAQLNQPYGIAVDTSGNVFVADTLNYRVRKITAATGVITTIAGTGTYGFSGDGGAATAAQLANPEGLAVTSTGDLYVAQQASNLVRKIAAGGTITTVAGESNRYGFGGDGGKATSAQMNGPSAVVVGGSGDLFIADTGNMEVREVVASSGVMNAAVGDGTQGFKGDGGAATSAELNHPRGLALDGAGNMYIADYGNSVVRKVTPGR